MARNFIPRRLVRIKALQNLYAYTIGQQAYKKGMIEEIENSFSFDIFLDAPDIKMKLEKEKKQLFHFSVKW